MRRELIPENVDLLVPGDIAVLKDKKSGEFIEFVVALLDSDADKIYLTTIDSDIAGYDTSEGLYATGRGNYKDYIRHFRTLLDPSKGAAAMSREHLIKTLQWQKYEIDGQEEE